MNIELTADTVEALVSTARTVERELRDPTLNPRLTRPIPSAVIMAWMAYQQRLRVLIAAESPIDKRPRRRPSLVSLLSAFSKVQDAIGGDAKLRSVIRFHGALLDMVAGKSR